MYKNFTLVPSDVREGRFLNLLTCTFSHIAVDHLLFNMLGLYCFGVPLARMLGPDRLLRYYVLGGLAGSAGHVLFSEWQRRDRGRGYRSFFARPSEPRVLGASGAVYSLTALFICMFPNTTILVFGIVPTPGWLFGLLYMGYDVQGLWRQGDGIGHAAHLGGAAMGLLYYAALRRGRLF